MNTQTTIPEDGPALTAADLQRSDDEASASASARSAPGESTSLIDKTRQSMRFLVPPMAKVRTFLDDFQEFMQQGSMVDLAVGLILGQSFTAILDSFVRDVLTPVLSLFSERSLINYYAVLRCPPAMDHCKSTSWPTWQLARDAGAVTVNYGQFAENVINFLTNALFLYIAIKKVFEIIFQHSVVLKQQCPACKEFVRGNAIICKECGMHLGDASRT